MINYSNTDNKQYYRISELVELIGIGQSTLYQWQRQGKFPRPDLRPSKRLCLYSAAQVQQWLASQQAAAAAAQQ